MTCIFALPRLRPAGPTTIKGQAMSSGVSHRLFYMCFSIVSFPSATSFSFPHLGRPWVPMRESVTSPRIALGLSTRDFGRFRLLNQAFRPFSFHKQVFRMATTRLEFGVEKPTKIPSTGLIEIEIKR